MQTNLSPEETMMIGECLNLGIAQLGKQQNEGAAGVGRQVAMKTLALDTLLQRLNAEFNAEQEALKAAAEKQAADAAKPVAPPNRKQRLAAQAEARKASKAKAEKPADKAAA